MTTCFGELDDTLVQRCSLSLTSSGQFRRTPGSCPPSCFLPTAAILEVIPVIFPLGNLPPQELLHKMQTSKSQLRRKESAWLTHQRGDPRDLPCLLAPLLSLLGPWPFGAPGPTRFPGHWWWCQPQARSSSEHGSHCAGGRISPLFVLQGQLQVPLT